MFMKIKVIEKKARTRKIEYLRYLFFCLIPPLIGWLCSLTPVGLYDNDVPSGNAIIEITSTIFGLGFGTGLLFIPVHWVAASLNAFRLVTLPVMVSMSAASAFITFIFIAPGNFVEYLQSKGVFWVFLGVTITCGTVVWRYYNYRRRAEHCRGGTIDDAAPGKFDV